MGFAWQRSEEGAILAKAGAHGQGPKEAAMTQTGDSSMAGAVPPMRFEHPEIGALARLARALDEAGAARRAPEGSMRARVGEIGRKAEEVQLAAGITCQAIEVLGEIEEALVFARDSAEEARSLRSMPASGVDLLQKQVDLAVNCVDYLAAEASFAGRRVFAGECIEAGAASVTLPRFSSDKIGARAVSRPSLAAADRLALRSRRLLPERRVRGDGRPQQPRLVARRSGRGHRGRRTRNRSYASGPHLVLQRRRAADGQGRRGKRLQRRRERFRRGEPRGSGEPAVAGEGRVPERSRAPAASGEGVLRLLD